MNVKENWFTQTHLKNFGTFEGWVSLHSEIHCLFFTIVKLSDFVLKKSMFFILLGNFIQYILIIFSFSQFLSLYRNTKLPFLLSLKQQNIESNLCWLVTLENRVCLEA